MTTVGVVAVLMAIAALGLTRRYVDLESSHQELVNSVRELRLRATLKGAHYRLTPSSSAYEIQRLRDDDGDGLWVPDPDAPPRVVELPPGVAIAAEKVSGDAAAVEFDTRGVMVDPDGAAAEVVRIALTDADGDRRVVEVWPSGQVQGQIIVGVLR